MADANPEVSAELAKARAATGIEDEAEMSSDESDIEETETSDTEEDTVVPAKKPKASEEEESGEEDEDAENDSEEGEEHSESKPDAPAKKSSPLKAAFTQIGELRKGQTATIAALADLATAIKDLKTATPATKDEATSEVKATVKDLIEKAKDAGADSEWLANFAETLRGEMKAEFEKEIGPLKALAEKGADAASKLDEKAQLAARQKAEANTFGNEWESIMPDLKKAYPNATQELLADARAEMRKLAMSKDYGGESLDGKENVGKTPMPLDYILYKERAKFDTLLKVKVGRSGENGSRDFSNDDDGEDEVDLSPDTMTPAKLKKYELKKQKSFEQPGIEIVS